MNDQIINKQSEEIRRQVYWSLMDYLDSEYSLPWVETICVPGYPCYDLYEEMLSAYQRLRERTGAGDEDEDAEIMIQSLLEYGEIADLEMFYYGMK